MYQIPLKRADIENLNRQCMHLNVFPIYLPNYFHNTDGNPVSKALRKLVAKCMEYLSCMIVGEIKRLIADLPQGVLMFIDFDDFTDVTEKSFLERLSIYYLVNELNKFHLGFKEIIRKTNSGAKAYKPVHYTHLLG